jgi:diaminohydroxyphosphoribosylaminopyrimidine deaminase/5-amino-6-(5-phosphoribosylamino)uracil reductase
MKKIYSKSDLMKLAVEEHLKCNEFPRVGVVVARDGMILSTGYRGEVPGLNAERVALQKISLEERIGTEVFTTLEPCVCLHEEQSVASCSDLIVSSGVSEVVIGVLDPNGTIYSQGYRQLLDNNISVSFFYSKIESGS